MKLKRWKQITQTSMVLAGFCLALLLLPACRSMTNTVKVDATISPAPVVGEIVTLRIHIVSPKYGGDGVFVIYYSDAINFLEVGPEWQVPLAGGDMDSLGWRGPIVADEPFVQEFSLCVTKPGNSVIYVQGGVVGKGLGGNQLHITSTADSAQVIPSSEYRGILQPPLGSTPTPTPEPVYVSPACTST